MKSFAAMLLLTGVVLLGLSAWIVALIFLALGFLASFAALTKPNHPIK